MPIPSIAPSSNTQAGMFNKMLNPMAGSKTKETNNSDSDSDQSAVLIQKYFIPVRKMLPFAQDNEIMNETMNFLIIL